ncbi:hypothetical protein C8J57DRAFT_1523362 [Mycena rebaudengoi]|nr:hypothetical protein C8J57DRAFT_1523362 [Mycena rebaudengoi]
MPYVDDLRPRNIHGRLPSTPRMPDNAQDNLQLLQLIADSRLTGYLAVASICVLIYDHIVCFPDEVGFFCVILREITTSSEYILRMFTGFGCSNGEDA